MLSKEQFENTRELEKRRIRRERALIIFVSFVFLLLTFLEIRFSHFGDKLSLVNSFVFYGFKNFSIILVLLLLFLLTRNIIKTYIERRKTLPGSRLRTKLVLVFVGFTVVPTILLFFISAFFIQSSFERWFSMRIERTFKESMDVANYLYRNTEDMALKKARNFRSFIEKERLFRATKKDFLKKVLRDRLKEEENIDAVEVIFRGGAHLLAGSEDYYKIVGPFEDYSKKGFEGNETTFIEHSGEGDIIRGVVPARKGEKIYAVVVVSKFIPLRLAKKLAEIRRYYDDYKSIKPLKIPLKSNYFVILILMTLMILFGATWFGIYFSRQISTPVAELVEGTEQIATGNFDVRIQYDAGDDEIGKLVKSFNKMAHDIKTGQDKLDSAYGSLKASNAQLREKQEYIEIVLRNISTGVIALNRKGVVTTINDYARKLLSVTSDEVCGMKYTDLIRGMSFEKGIRETIDEMSRKSLSSIERNLVGKFRGKELFLRINISLLKDLGKRYLGVVVVFDDLSELQKSQRMAAWREVARRIAHEIKNPLTPIQLSAQRLNMRYAERFSANSDDREIFSQCTGMIIDQVEGIKRMVNEFAAFARMPASNPALVSLDAIIRDVVRVYMEISNRVSIEYHNFSSVDMLFLDVNQMKRVFINLIDNSIAALEGIKDPEITIIVSNNEILEIVSIEVVDNGSGISPEAMDRLFEPYFSTRGSGGGTGLGLTIVQQIITDHSGYIRVSSSNDTGARFLIELPSHQNTVVYGVMGPESSVTA